MSERKSNNLLKRVFLSYAPSFKGYWFLTILLFVAYGLAALISNVMLPLVYRSIIDTVSATEIRQSVADTLFRSFSWLVIGIVAHNTFYRVGDYLIVYVESRMMKRVSDRTFSALEQHSYHFFSGNFVGSLVAKAKRYVKSFEDLFDQTVFSLWMTIIKLVGIFVALLVLSLVLGVALFVWTTIYLCAAWWISQKKSPYDLAVAEQDSTVVGRLSDVVSNMLAVKMFSSGTRERSQFEEATRVEERLRRRAWNFQNLTFVIQFSLLGALEIGGMYGAIRMWLNGTISAGTVALVQIYIYNIFEAFFILTRVFSKMTESLSYADEMVEVLESTPDVLDPECPEENRMRRGNISFDRVSFQYADGENVFTDFSLAIRDGEKVGIVGPSGAGKSTVTKLLLRFVDPQDGEIRVDGKGVSGSLAGEQFDSERMTLVAADLAYGTDPNLYIISGTKYKNGGGGTEAIGFIAEGSIDFPYDSDDNLTINGALLAQKGSVSRANYGNAKNKITIFGAIASKGRIGFGYTNGTGYQDRELHFDENLSISPPPYFPTGKQYLIDLWEEL